MPDILEIPDPHVLVGVDGSVESLAALGLAATEARLRDAALVATHAWAGPSWRPGRDGGEHLSRVEAERLLANATDWLRLHHPDVIVTGRLVLGDPVQVLTAGSAAAQLVVVGYRGKGLHLLGWGSVAAQLSRRCKTPLIVRIFRPEAGDPLPLAPVVVAVTPRSSGRTLRFAFEEAARFGVPLAPCYVWTPTSEPGGQHWSPEQYAEARAEASRILADTLSGWSSQYPEVDVRSEVRHGWDVAHTLAVAARQARLLVVGAGPDNALVEVLCGSVSRGVLRSAACPVAVVPEPMSPAPLADASPERASTVRPPVVDVSLPELSSEVPAVAAPTAFTPPTPEYERAGAGVSSGVG